MSDTLRHLAVCLATALILMSPGIPRVNAREMVAFSGYAPGMIVGKTGQRRLYYVVDDRRALRFPVGVGRERVQLAARNGPHGVELGPRALEHVGRHDRLADEGEIRIGAEEIHAARRRHAVLGRGRHAPPFHHIGRVGARCWPVGPGSVL